MIEFQVTKIVKKQERNIDAVSATEQYQKDSLVITPQGRARESFSASISVTLAGNYRISFQTAYATGGRDTGAMRFSMILAVSTRYQHRFNY